MANGVTELRLIDVGPFLPYSLDTLVDFGIVKIGDAVRLAGIKPMRTHSTKSDYRLHQHMIDSDLAAKLNEVGFKVPDDKKDVFGENYQRLVEYNNALMKPLSTEGSPKFKNALYEWHKSIDPQRISHPLEHYLQNAAAYNPALAAIWAAGAYIRDKIKAGKIDEQAAKQLANLFRKAAEERENEKKAYSQNDFKTLSLLADNSALVLGIYYQGLPKAKEFKANFRKQVEALVTLYIDKSESWTRSWNRAIRDYARQMKELLNA
ncbi:hypothetical protein HYX01_01955 [Candidatus Woesearchaeota archaeon]|nr:hypothetical protein [Candidatus Woesearchaeota archaeon]